MPLTRAELARYVDHTLLAPTASSDDVRAILIEAQDLGTYSICVSPSMLPLPWPTGDVLVATVCGFPSGKHTAETKAFEAAQSVASGADEVDMVIDVGRLKAGDAAHTAAEIKAVRDAVPGSVLKVIIESAALTDEEIVAACQAAFNLQTDVPTCTGARDGSCITSEQKGVLASIFAGPKNSKGEAQYAGTWWDPGIAGANFASWHFGSPATRDAGAVAFIFTSPPSSVAAFTAIPGMQYALNFSMETDYPKMFATTAKYTESPWSYMTPPNETDLSTLKNRGAKMIVFHGVADGVFSPMDTANWMDRLQANHSGKADAFARLFLVPGMNHCSGGPATDQFDMLTNLVNWVEKAQVPDQVIAKVRGTGANVVNTELPASWSATRSRPLCAYPTVARYKGSGDLENAANFSCQ